MAKVPGLLEIWPGQHYLRREKGMMPALLPKPQLWGNSPQKFGSQPSAAWGLLVSHSQDGQVQTTYPSTTSKGQMVQDPNGH